MKTVTLAYAIENGQRILIGVGESVDKAVDLIKKSGFGFHLEIYQLNLLAILGYTVNMEVNFKLETWQVH